MKIPPSIVTKQMPRKVLVEVVRVYECSLCESLTLCVFNPFHFMYCLTGNLFRGNVSRVAGRTRFS